MPGSGNARVGVSIGTVSACTYGIPSFSATCGAANVFWWATIASGGWAFATIQLSSSIPRITGKTSWRREGFFLSGVGNSDRKSARIGANPTPS